MAGLNILRVPMAAITHFADRVLGGADQLGDLRIFQFRGVFDQPGDGVRLVAALGHRHIAWPLGAGDRLGQGALGRHQAQTLIGAAALDFLARHLAVGYRVETLHAGIDLAVGDGLHLKRMQLAKVGDLIEAESGIID